MYLHLKMSIPFSITVWFASHAAWDPSREEDKRQKSKEVCLFTSLSRTREEETVRYVVWEGKCAQQAWSCFNGTDRIGKKTISVWGCFLVAFVRVSTLCSPLVFVFLLLTRLPWRGSLEFLSGELGRLWTGPTAPQPSRSHGFPWRWNNARPRDPWNPFALATGSVAALDGGPDVCLEIHLPLPTRNLQWTQQERTQRG